MPKRTTTFRLSNSMVIIMMLAVFMVLIGGLFNSLYSGGSLQTSTLNTTFNRLNSTEVIFEIPEPGRLRINAGPTTLLGEASVFGLVLRSSQAQPTGTTPFQVSAAYETIFNLVNPTDPNELQLAVIFPPGQFTSAVGTLAELPFTTSVEGQFEIQALYFGSLPNNNFPPYQDYPIYIESSNILFDENGASKQVQPPSTDPNANQDPACSDGLDNDFDGETDFPDDPGCEDADDTSEVDPVGPEPLRLDIPSQYIKTLTTLSGEEQYLVILPPAQEQLQYDFQFNAEGGDSDDYVYGVKGKAPNSNGVYILENSGLHLRESGRLSGDPGKLKGGSYRYQFFVTDGQEVLNFAVQISVHDALGNPVGLRIETNIAGDEHQCFVNQLCEAFFRTSQGIPPYQYSFTGESPTGSSFLQVNAGEAFYRFVPTAEQLGEYNMIISVFDSSERKVLQGETEVETTNTASLEYTLSIETPDIETTFRFAAEPECNFLDLSAVEPTYDFFQFTCRNGIIEGSDGLVREFDALNRAEAAKVTSLIVANEDVVDQFFAPFVNLPNSSAVNYNDVTVGDWYADYVYYLFQQGIIIDNTLYRPADTLNIAEAMKLVIESYASLNPQLLADLEDITGFTEWYDPYQTVASYVDATIAFLDPAEPASRGLIAELLFKLHREYPVDKFQ